MPNYSEVETHLKKLAKDYHLAKKEMDLINVDYQEVQVQFNEPAIGLMKRRVLKPYVNDFAEKLNNFSKQMGQIRRSANTYVSDTIDERTRNLQHTGAKINPGPMTRDNLNKLFSQLIGEQ